MRAQFLRYAGAGAVGTLAQYALLVALVQGQVAGPVLAATLGALLGALVNYVLNHRFTFGSARPHAHALPRFAAVAAAGIAVNALVVAVLVHAGIHYLVAQVVATGVVLVVGYLANRAWTF
ncbi:MAG: GtrA family protein [Burkholderiales bacterium]